MVAEFLNARMKLYSRDIATIGLSPYVVGCLNGCGCKTVGEIANMTVQDLLKIAGIGIEYYAEIVKKMDELGFKIANLPTATQSCTYDPSQIIHTRTI